MAGVVSAVAAAEQLCAARVVGDGDEDPDRALRDPVEFVEDRVVFVIYEWVDEQGGVADSDGVARHGGAELAGVPLRVAALPSPQVVV